MRYIHRVYTACGEWEIEATDCAVVRVSNRLTEEQACPNDVCLQAQKELEEYFAGTRYGFSVPLELRGTVFQQQVWEALLQIPYGQSTHYAQIAEQIGRPAAVRAVANAIGRNPCLILVPCHRVLGKNGTLTGFSAGLDVKRTLLQREGIFWEN